jgi:hypothetical protein
VRVAGIPFGTTAWSKVEQTAHKGERGFAYWRTQKFGIIRGGFLKRVCARTKDGTVVLALPDFTGILAALDARASIKQESAPLEDDGRMTAVRARCARRRFAKVHG